jgi:transcriptional regulator of acetoin/glycerol metabolism
MKLNDTEAFIRAAAARNWSKRQTASALGINRDKFDLMALALSDVQWAPPGQTVLRKAILKNGNFASAGRAKGRASQRAACLHTVGDHTGTIPELASLAGVTASTLYRRLATMSLDEAFALPKRKPVPPQCRNKAEVIHAALH